MGSIPCLTIQMIQQFGGFKLKKIYILFGISLFLIAASFWPMFQSFREFWAGYKINTQYDIQHAYERPDGWKDIVDSPHLTVNGLQIGIAEKPTGQLAPLTEWDRDENVPPGEITEIHFLLNGKQISSADEIWLSNRSRGSRYFSWLDILTVKNRSTGESSIKIVQRLTDDLIPLDSRQWKIITIDHKPERNRGKIFL